MQDLKQAMNEIKKNFDNKSLKQKNLEAKMNGYLEVVENVKQSTADLQQRAEAAIRQSWKFTKCQCDHCGKNSTPT